MLMMLFSCQSVEIYIRKAVRFVQLQPHFHSKARQLSPQLWTSSIKSGDQCRRPIKSRNCKFGAVWRSNFAVEFRKEEGKIHLPHLLSLRPLLMQTVYWKGKRLLLESKLCRQGMVSCDLPTAILAIAYDDQALVSWFFQLKLNW